MTPEEQVQFETFLRLASVLNTSARHVDTAPSYTPKNLLEQFVLYKNGSTYRLYVWFGPDEGWRYVGLT